MKLKEITATIEAFAPLALQEPYDNSGLQYGDPDMDVTSALLCVDATEDVLAEAEAIGANLVISHHPIIFHPLRSIGTRNNVDRVVARAIRTGIAIYAAHTNLDRAAGGMSHALARKLGLQNISTLDPESGSTGFGAVGELSAPTDAMDFLRGVKRTLGIGCIRHSEPPKKKVRKIALITGAGGDGLEKAIDAGADAFLSADLRHDRFLAARGRILLADVGHYESEFCATELIYEVISKKIANFALHISAKERNPVDYLI